MILQFPIKPKAGDVHQRWQFDGAVWAKLQGRADGGLQFPSDPAVGDTFGNWKWDGEVWVSLPGPQGTVTLVNTSTGLTGGPIIESGTIALANTPVVAGSYSHADIMVDAQGRLIAASDGTGLATGTVTSVGTGTGLMGGPITTTGTIALANTGVTPNTYNYATITVDQQGRITAASSGTAPPSLANVAFTNAANTFTQQQTFSPGTDWLTPAGAQGGSIWASGEPPDQTFYFSTTGTGTLALIQGGAPRLILQSNNLYTGPHTFYAGGGANIKGVTDGSDAPAGYVGEYKGSIDGVNLTNGVVANCTFIGLTPGDWDVGSLGVYTGGTVNYYFRIGVSTASATLQGWAYGAVDWGTQGAGLNGTLNVTGPTTRLSVATGVTVYCVAQASFQGSAAATGVIWARRMR